MKAILIQGAMDIEINLFKSTFRAVLDKSIGGFEFYKAFLYGCPIIISKTNIGMSNASCATTIGIMEYDPAVIINQGIAGGYGNVQTCDIVFGKNTVNINSFEKPAREEGIDYKSWVHTDFKEYDDNKDAKNTLQCNEELMEFFSKVHYASGVMHKGKIGSGDVWNKETDFINFLQEKLGVLCEDMETAAVYNVANRFNVPVIGIRVISNNEILKEDYSLDAAKYCQRFILSCLEKSENIKKLQRMKSV